MFSVLDFRVIHLFSDAEGEGESVSKFFFYMDSLKSVLPYLFKYYVIQFQA